MLLKSHRSRLIASFIAVALVPLLVVVCYQSYWIAQEVRIEHERQSRTVQQIASELTAFVEMHRRGIEAAAEQITLSQRRDKKDFDAILAALHRQFPGFINLYFADTSAKTLAFFPELNAQGQSMVGVDFSQRWHFKALNQELKTYISPVMKGVGGTDKLLCTIVAPYFSADGQFDGFVLGALNLSQIGPLLQAMALPPLSYAVVTDALGQAIYSPEWSDDTIQSWGNQLELLDPSVASGEVQRLRHLSAVTGQLVVSAVTHMQEPQWVVWLSTPAAHEDAAMRRWVVMSLALIVATFLAVLLLSKTLAGHLTQSIERLCRKARMIEEHRFQRLDATSLRASDAAELRVLDQAMTVMAGSLEKAHGDLLATNAMLEARVCARTATLSRALECMHEGFGLIEKDGTFAVVNRALMEFVAPQVSVAALTRQDFLTVLTSKTDLSQEQAARLINTPMSACVVTDLGN